LGVLGRGEVGGERKHSKCTKGERANRGELKKTDLRGKLRFARVWDSGGSFVF